MPGMDGVEASRRLRDDPVTAAIPIIALPAQDRLQATAARMVADDRLPKPFEVTGLFAAVARWVPAYCGRSGQPSGRQTQRVRRTGAKRAMARSHAILDDRGACAGAWLCAVPVCRALSDQRKGGRAL